MDREAWMSQERDGIGRLNGEIYTMASLLLTAVNQHRPKVAETHRPLPPAAA